MDGFFCLKWNHHSSSFLQNLRDLHDKELYCDATITCQGHFYPVHKLVLAACSDYFREIFEKAECKHPFIVLKDIYPKELEALLDYMYKGEANVLQETITGLMQAAEALKIKGLVIPDETESHRNTSCETNTVDRDRKRSTSPCSIPESSPPINGADLCSENVHKKIKCELESENVIHNLENGSQLSSPLEPQKNSCIKSVLSNIEMEKSEAVKEELFPSSLIEIGDVPAESADDEDSFDDNSVNFFNRRTSEPSEESPAVFGSLLFPDCGPTLLRADSDSERDIPQLNSLFNVAAQCSSWSANDHAGMNSSSFDGSHFPGEVFKKRRSKFFSRSSESASSLLSRNSFMRKHMMHTSSSIFQLLQCERCPYRCKKEISMQKHMLRKHSPTKPEKTENGNEKIQNALKCCYCSYATIQPSRLKSHMSIHTGYKPYSCTYCVYKSSQSGTMKRHIQNVHKDKFHN